jgi:hypothetical protein
LLREKVAEPAMTGEILNSAGTLPTIVNTCISARMVTRVTDVHGLTGENESRLNFGKAKGGISWNRSVTTFSFAHNRKAKE